MTHGSAIDMIYTPGPLAVHAFIVPADGSVMRCSWVTLKAHGLPMGHSWVCRGFVMGLQWASWVCHMDLPPFGCAGQGLPWARRAPRLGLPWFPFEFRCWPMRVSDGIPVDSN